MKTQVLANDEVVLRLGISEHLALSDSLFLVLMDGEAPRSPGLSCADAYDFAHSVRLAEAAAREAGTSWLASEVDDVWSTDAAPARISFAQDGSEWRLTLEQLWLLESCANQAARLVGAE